MPRRRAHSGLNLGFSLVLTLGCQSTLAGNDGADTTGSDTADDGGGTCLLANAATCAPDGGSVDPETVEAWMAEGPVTIIDARASADFQSAHLPEAVNVDPGSLRATVDGVSGQVADDTTLATVFSTAGVDPETPVVVYGPDIETASARVVWTLAYAGHGPPVYLMDGGFTAWTAEGRATESADDPPASSEYVVETIGGLRVDGTWVFEHLDDASVTLVDARTPTEFSAGRIPGAVNVDWTTNVGSDGRFVGDPDLRVLYGSPDDGQTLVVYCASGSRASVAWVALRTLGYADVRLYDGSWNEWSTNAAWPVETD